MASSYKDQLADYYRKHHDYSGINISDFNGKKSGKYVSSVSLQSASGKSLVIVTTYTNIVAFMRSTLL